MFSWVPPPEPAPDKIAVEPGSEPTKPRKPNPQPEPNALKVAVDPYAEITRFRS